MTISGSRGHYAFALQTGKVGDNTYPGSYIHSDGWQRHRVVAGDLGLVEMRDALSPTVGGGLFVDGTYKNGVAVGGTLAMEARLQGALGYLLYAAAGSVSGTASAASTGYITKFYVNQADQTTMPWLSFFKYTPATTAASSGSSEYFVDCKVGGLTLTLPQTGVLSAQAVISGRKPLATTAEDTPASMAYESSTGVALSCSSSISATFDAISALTAATKSTPTDVSFMGAEITIVNGLTGPREEMQIGSYYMDDLVPLTRGAIVRLAYKWKDADLYHRIIYGDDVMTKGAWTPTMQTGSVTVTAQSAANISDTYTHPYKLIFTTPSVDWAIDPPQLAGGRMLATTLTAVVKETNSASSAPWSLTLWNTKNYGFCSYS